MAQAQRGVGGVGLEVRRVGGALERLRRALRAQALHLAVARPGRPAGSRSSRAEQRSTLSSAAITVFCSGAPSSATAAAAAASQRLALARRARAGRSPAARAPCPGCACGRRRCAPCRPAGAGCTRRSSAAAPRSRPRSRNSARAPSKASRASRSASTASSTRNSGSIPAASACVRSTRAQKPWIVEIQAASASRACPISLRSTKRARTRCLSWAAAFSVNVIARIDVHVHAVVAARRARSARPAPRSCRCRRPRSPGSSCRAARSPSAAGR